MALTKDGGLPTKVHHCPHEQTENSGGNFSKAVEI